jgi:hypothetical protein
MRKALPLLLLLMSLASFAQTTSSHPVTGGSGTATTPTRISFSAMGGVNFLSLATVRVAAARQPRLWDSCC